MASCIELTQDGQLVVANPQPVDLSSCSAVLLSGPEAVSAVNPVFQPLSMQQGGEIAAAISLVWAVAFLLRSYGRGLLVPKSEESL